MFLFRVPIILYNFLISFNPPPLVIQRRRRNGELIIKISEKKERRKKKMKTKTNCVTHSRSLVGAGGGVYSTRCELRMVVLYASSHFRFSSFPIIVRLSSYFRHPPLSFFLHFFFLVSFRRDTFCLFFFFSPIALVYNFWSTPPATRFQLIGNWLLRSNFIDILKNKQTKNSHP